MSQAVPTAPRIVMKTEKILCALIRSMRND